MSILSYKGQITINEWLGYPEYYDQCGRQMQSYIREGFRNSYHEKPDHECLCIVIDHAGHRYKARYYKNNLGTWVWEASESRGYDICWWKECGDCNTCRFKFWKHKDGKAIQGCQCRGGSECYYEPKLEKTCLTCGYFRTIVDATTCEPIEKRCNPGDGYSYAVSYPETHTCEKWKEVDK